LTYCSRKSRDLAGLRNSSNFRPDELRELLLDDLVAEVDALVADVDRPGPAMSFLTCFWLFPQKSTLAGLRLTDACHLLPPPRGIRPGLGTCV
jgi:hypothetical protein